MIFYTNTIYCDSLQNAVTSSPVFQKLSNVSNPILKRYLGSHPCRILIMIFCFVVESELSSHRIIVNFGFIKNLIFDYTQKNTHLKRKIKKKKSIV